MATGTGYTEAVTLTRIDCGRCAGTYAISERYRKQKAQEGGSWNCPYCCVSWGYANDNENARLKRELEATKSNEQWYKQRATIDALRAENERLRDALRDVRHEANRARSRRDSPKKRIVRDCT